MTAPAIDRERLLARLRQLGEVGADPRGGRTRLALSEEDRAGRDLVAGWMRQAGASVHVDRIGNMHAVLEGSGGGAPIMTGSHIDTVRRAGAYDGCYGVVAGIEVLDAIARLPGRPARTVVATAFTNEEGVRFAPDLLGSRVLAKDISLDEALAAVSGDGAVLGAELERIGYAGRDSPWRFLPAAFVELHIEQGPVLDRDGARIGIVRGVQGYSWWQVSIAGRANHAGTTPMDMRLDAGAAAMSLAAELAERARREGVPRVATVGTFELEPAAINVVPGRAVFTVDFRDLDDETLREAERRLRRALRRLDERGYATSMQCLARTAAVRFDAALCDEIAGLAAAARLPCADMHSGASHDAQMMAGICPTAMIFVPSKDGISHNPQEHTEPADLAAGAGLLLETMLQLAQAGGRTAQHKGSEHGITRL